MVAVTDAEETAPNLEPWIQWVTVHTGLSFAEHGCFNLNEGSDLTAPRLWDLVSRADQTNWICGSMNAAVQPGFRGCFLPDPWATSAEPVPLNMFRPYARLVRSYVQEHSGRPEVSPVDVLRFGQFMLRHGLSASSVAALIKQLAQERRRDVKWRRAMMLDRLQWDVFRSVYKSMQPYLSTFFINSTAHFQHFHWREFEPGLFRIQSSEKQRQTYGDAILAGYQNMDRIVGEALSMARDEANLVLLTALSQQPMLTHEEDGGVRSSAIEISKSCLNWRELSRGGHTPPSCRSSFCFISRTNRQPRPPPHRSRRCGLLTVGNRCGLAGKGVAWMPDA
ncbi:hypothetical protein ACFSHP_12310 [Novosphingobium panipatense]